MTVDVLLAGVGMTDVAEDTPVFLAHAVSINGSADVLLLLLMMLLVLLVLLVMLLVVVLLVFINN